MRVFLEEKAAIMMSSKRQRTNSNSSGARQQATLLGLWKKKKPEDDGNKQSSSGAAIGNSSPAGRKRERNNDSDQSTSRRASCNNRNTILSTLLTNKKPQWENISLQHNDNNNAPMLILRGGMEGTKKTSTIRKSLVALPDWNENVTFHAFGRQCTMRRRICQYSLQGKFTYSYSGLKNVEAPAFPPNLYEIKCRVEDLMIEYIRSNLETIEKDFSLSREFIELINKSHGEQRVDIFNYCLLNHYRNGEEYMSYHSDDEPSLCPYTPIASISFGVTRSFDIRQKKKIMTKGSGTNEKQRSRIARIPLGDGDVLLMFPPMQHYYEHALPVEKRVVGERINLTFRRLV